MTCYAVVYSTGFWLGQAEGLIRVLPCVRAATVMPFSSAESAYVYACRLYVQQALTREPFRQPVLPRFDQMQSGRMFVAPGQLPIPKENKVYYAAVSIDACGILTVENVGEFLGRFSWSYIEEFATHAAAEGFIRRWYLERVLPMSAYYAQPIPVLAEHIPINTFVPVQYRTWLEKQQMGVPVQLPFQKALTANSLEDDA